MLVPNSFFSMSSERDNDFENFGWKIDENVLLNDARQSEWKHWHGLNNDFWGKVVFI